MESLSEVIKNGGANAPALPTKKGGRVYYEYTVPAHIDNPYRTFVLMETTASEQILMSKMLPRNATAEEIAQGMVRVAIFALDGRPVNQTSIEFEDAWEKTHPKVRSFMKDEITRLQITTKEEDDAFLKSRVCTVG